MARKSRMDKGFGLVPGATEPLGLLYIASFLKKGGHEVWVIDSIFSSTEDTIRFIRDKDPGILGVTIISFSWERAKVFLSEIKHNFPGLLTIVGGPFPTAWQEKCLQESPHIDFACIGEGEHIMRQLCGCLENGGEPGKIKGLIWRDKSGTVIKNEYAPLLEDLDELPFPQRSLVDMGRYSPSIGFYKRLPNATIVGSRGCSHSCLFCHTQTLGPKVRYRSPGNVVDEMQEVIERHKVRDILFWDNNLTENRHRIFQICQEILGRNIKIAWSGNTRADTADEQTLRIMKKAGCRRLLMGIESGVQKNLDILRKGETIGQIEHAVSLCKKLNIEIFATFIFGIPGETYEEGLQTIEFACRLNPEYAKFFTLACHPGTELFRDIEKYGVMSSFTAAQSHQNAGFIPYTMKKNDVEKLLNMAYRGFYLRPKYIFMKILKIRSIEDLRQNIRGLAAFINIPRNVN
jgi:radical SAM superfamily enzyme YgiQ (UPF0313 family)